MNASFFAAIVVSGVSLVLVSCATELSRDGAAGSAFSTTSLAAEVPATAKRASESAGVETSHDGRLRIYRGHQVVEVADVAVSMELVEKRVEASKGYVESSTASRNGRDSTSLVLRVPATEWAELLDDFAALGKETSRRIMVEDTTDAYLDLEARIRNTEALRDRLRGLLDSAKTVKEIMEIEKELARVQAQLDSMEGKFRLMQSQVRLARIDLTLKTREIPGPVGAANQGLWWAIRKMFVLN